MEKIIQRLVTRSVLSRIIQNPNFNNNIKKIHTSGLLYESFNVQDEEDFEKRVIKNEKPVIVDFHAVWCAPCKTIGPRLEEIIGATKGKVDLAKVNIDDNPELAIQYSIAAIPALLSFKKGQVVQRSVGLIDDDKIKSFIDKLNE